MIAYALQKKHKVFLYTTLVGASLQDIDFLIDNLENISDITLHLPDNDQNFRARITQGYKKVLRRFLTNEAIKGKILRKENVKLMTMHYEGLVDQEFKDLVAFTKVPDFNIISSRAGNLSNEEEKDFGKKEPIYKSGKLVCSAAPSLNSNVVLPNGDVVLCCMDYSLEHKIGNLLQDSYETLFSSDAYKHIKYLLDNEDNNHKLLCRNCEIAVENTISNKIRMTIIHNPRYKSAVNAFYRNPYYSLHKRLGKKIRKMRKIFS